MTESGATYTIGDIVKITWPHAIKMYHDSYGEITDISPSHGSEGDGYLYRVEYMNRKESSSDNLYNARPSWGLWPTHADNEPCFRLVAKGS